MKELAPMVNGLYINIHKISLINKHSLNPVFSVTRPLLRSSLSIAGPFGENITYEGVSRRN